MSNRDQSAESILPQTSSSHVGDATNSRADIEALAAPQLLALAKRLIEENAIYESHMHRYLRTHEQIGADYDAINKDIISQQAATIREQAGEIERLKDKLTRMLCEDCPPVGYPTDKTRCTPCPRRAALGQQGEGAR